MKHYELATDIGDIKVSVIQNAPLVTVELRNMRGYLLSYGISYCRPEDKKHWDNIKGISLALQHAIKNSKIPVDSKKIWEFFVEEFKRIKLADIAEAKHRWETKIRPALDKAVKEGGHLIQGRGGNIYIDGKRVS